MKGINLPAAGFIAEARSLGHTLVPLLLVLGAAFGIRDARCVRDHRATHAR